MNIHNKDFRRKVDNWVEENKDNFIQDVIDFINIKSVSSEKYENYPYGKGCAQMLDTALELCEDNGFKTKNHEYYCGTFELEGTTNKKEIGIFGHLDVVPEGENWKETWEFEPYNATVYKGHIIGRGSADNKGPALAAFYSMKFLKENSITLKNKVKYYYGCSEEAGMSDIEYYLAHNQAPDLSLVPDAHFSVCYAEKGILQMTASIDIGQGNLKDFNAGEVTNVIPANAYAIVDDLDYESAIKVFADYEGIEVSKLDDGVKIIATGKSKHAAFPEGSVNAIGLLASALTESQTLKADVVSPIKFISDSLKDYHGASLDIAYEDDISGKITHVAGITWVTDGRLFINYNLRYPVTIDHEEMISKIRGAFENTGFKIDMLINNPPAYNSPDHPIIKILSDISDDILQAEYKPYAMGGGTYVRKLPNAFGYGMGIEDKLPLFTDNRGGGHQPDECVGIDDLLNGIKIYIYALLSVDEYLETV